eukprot:868679-Pyramimonas_sp.AAC.1
MVAKKARSAEPEGSEADAAAAPPDNPEATKPLEAVKDFALAAGHKVPEAEDEARLLAKQFRQNTRANPPY